MSQFMCQSPGQMGILIKGVRLFFIYIFIYLFLDYCSSMSFIYQCLVRKNELFRDKKFNRCFALCSQYQVQMFLQTCKPFSILWGNHVCIYHAVAMVTTLGNGCLLDHIAFLNGPVILLMFIFHFHVFWVIVIKNCHFNVGSINRCTH